MTRAERLQGGVEKAEAAMREVEGRRDALAAERSVVDADIATARTIAAIEEIRVNGSATVSMKGGLGKPCRALVSQPVPAIIFVDNKPPPAASEEEAEEDIDEDCDAYQEGMQAYDDEIDEQAEVLTYATAREQRNFLEGYKRAKDEDEGVFDGE